MFLPGRTSRSVTTAWMAALGGRTGGNPNLPKNKNRLQKMFSTNLRGKPSYAKIVKIGSVNSSIGNWHEFM